MIGTLILLTALSFKNRIWQRIRRLKEPRYLIGGIAGALYFWFMIFRSTHRAAPRHLHYPPTGDLIQLAIAAGFLVMMIVAWALPGDRGGLEFSEAEMAFLFPAPLKRRQLLLYKIIRAQPQALISATFFTILTPVRGKFIGTWLAVSVISIYFMVVALGRARLRLMHIGFFARLIAVGATLAGLSWYATRLASQMHVRDPNKLTALMHRPEVRILLFVPRAFASAVMPQSLTMLVTACIGLLLLGVTFFYIAAGINVSFQEASIAGAQKRVARLQRIRDQRIGAHVMFGRIPAPFRLRETGTPEVAFIWKNVIALLRTNIAWVVLMFALNVLVVAQAVWAHEPVGYKVCGMLLMMLAALFPFLGVQLFANDLRLDLRRAEVLKSYPIAGDRLVAAEIAAPLVVITTFELFFLIAGTTLLHLGETTNPMVNFLATPQFIVVALLMALPICALQLLLRNAAPVYFPAWVLRSKDDQRGFVAAGQRMIVLFANILALALVLIPAGIVFLPSAWIAWRFFSNSPVGLAVATMPAIAVIAGEVFFGLKILGAQFERLDVSNEFDIATT